MPMSGFPCTLVTRGPVGGLVNMQVVAGVLVAFGIQVCEGFIGLRMFLQYGIGLVTLTCCGDLVPPMGCGGDVDPQGLS